MPVSVARLGINRRVCHERFGTKGPPGQIISASTVSPPLKYLVVRVTVQEEENAWQIEVQSS